MKKIFCNEKEQKFDLILRLSSSMTNILSYRAELIKFLQAQYFDIYILYRFKKYRSIKHSSMYKKSKKT